MNVQTLLNVSSDEPNALDSLNVILACVWYLDSGYSRHITGDKSMLTNYVNKFLGTIRFGNDEIATIEGYGDYVFNGVTIKRVSYVRGLGCCLFSVSQFCDSDLCVIFERFMCCVQTMEGDNLLEGKRESTLYSLAMKNMSSDLQPLCLVSKASSETSWLWHHRITDNGTEFQNSVLNSYLDQAGITHQTSAARTPQQNGVVERRNRTLVEAARTMLVYSKLPPSLWAEAVNTACFTQNRSIINRRFDKTPYELLFNRRPNVKYFRIFGCVCYVLNDEDNLGKFDVCGDEAIFISYSQDRVAYHTRSLDATTPPILATEQNTDTLVPLWEENATYPTDNTELTGSSSSSHIDTSLDDGSTSPLPHSMKWTADHPIHQIIGDPDAPVRTCKASNNECLFTAFLSTIEPKTDFEALQDPDCQVMRIFSYLKGTPNLRIWYPFGTGFNLTAFTDADHGGDQVNRKSTSGGLQFLGRKLVSWSSRKQNCISLSIAESEYIAAASCCSQVLWMQSQLLDYGFKFHKIPIYCDSQSAIAITSNPVHHSRTKHIDIRYYFIKDHVEKGNVELYFVPTKSQLADLLTKALDEPKFKKYGW
ncbi:uncharacterized protein [Rutidosis leptorrhynchoides]|uniref:uncharacterized protein n=1 Tax=Rutidosis leptorrhynchoides TaxID=125765 RepID=UPI003A9944F3